MNGRDKATVRVAIAFTGDKPRPTTYTLVRDLCRLAHRRRIVRR